MAESTSEPEGLSSAEASSGLEAGAGLSLGSFQSSTGGFRTQVERRRLLGASGELLGIDSASLSGAGEADGEGTQDEAGIEVPALGAVLEPGAVELEPGIE